MPEDRICLPRCFEPTWPSCSSEDANSPPVVSLCCFEIGFPDDYTDAEDPPVTHDCSKGVYSCEPDWDDLGIGSFHGPSTNYNGSAGWSYLLTINGLPATYPVVVPFVAKPYGWHDIHGGCWGSEEWGEAFSACYEAYDSYLQSIGVPIELWGCGSQAPDLGATVDFIVKWSCTGNGVIHFQAGLSLRPMREISSDPSLVAALTECWFCPHYEGYFSADWWRSNIIGPGPQYGPIRLYRSPGGLMGDYVDFGISKGCTWIPCGPTTDCFPDCISGTVECDGTTPAHSPLMLTIDAAESCCLTGTFPLIYNDSSHVYRIPPEAIPSCVVDSDCAGPDPTMTMGAELRCSSSNAPEDPLSDWYQDDSGLAMLHIWMTDGCGDRQDFYALVVLLCDGGSLVEDSGRFDIDTMCGDNTTNHFNWVISA